MRFSQKCLYALRAVYELAAREGEGPVTISAIGESQGVPAPFLQVILRELKQGEFVESRRGKEGGYVIARRPSEICLGEVIRFVEGEVGGIEEGDAKSGRAQARDPFGCLWAEVAREACAVYDRITFADLLERAAALAPQEGSDYTI